MRAGLGDSEDLLLASFGQVNLFTLFFRRPRGMFFSANDVGEMAQMVFNWEHDEVDAVVVTDGSR